MVPDHHNQTLISQTVLIILLILSIDFEKLLNGWILIEADAIINTDDYPLTSLTWLFLASYHDSELVC
jgi:hypothetical protein